MICGRDGCSSPTSNPGNYYGIDISPDILLAAQETLARDDLQAKLPHLELVDDLKFRFLPPEQFTVVHAHSVFSHSPIEVIDECLANVGRVMRPDGVFDFTFCRTKGTEHQVLREDFYYRTETLLALADAHGLDAGTTGGLGGTATSPVQDQGDAPARPALLSSAGAARPGSTTGSTTGQHC